LHSLVITQAEGCEIHGFPSLVKLKPVRRQ
jgi:hypothetical protein